MMGKTLIEEGHEKLEHLKESVKKSKKLLDECEEY